jgi:hypothetical protein
MRGENERGEGQEEERMKPAKKLFAYTQVHTPLGSHNGLSLFLALALEKSKERWDISFIHAHSHSNTNSHTRTHAQHTLTHAVWRQRVTVRDPKHRFIEIGEETPSYHHRSS